jgi:hypothetical protein
MNSEKVTGRTNEISMTFIGYLGDTLERKNDMFKILLMTMKITERNGCIAHKE